MEKVCVIEADSLMSADHAHLLLKIRERFGTIKLFIFVNPENSNFQKHSQTLKKLWEDFNAEVLFTDLPLTTIIKLVQEHPIKKLVILSNSTGFLLGSAELPVKLTYVRVSFRNSQPSLAFEELRKQHDVREVEVLSRTEGRLARLLSLNLDLALELSKKRPSSNSNFKRKLPKHASLQDFINICKERKVPSPIEKLYLLALHQEVKIYKKDNTTYVKKNW